MKKLFLLLLLLASTTLSAQNVSFGPETVVTGPFHHLVLAASPEWRVPAFAAAGRAGQYLLAWTEFDIPTSRTRLMTAQLDSTGRIVEGSRRTAPAVRTDDPDAQFPAVAFDGERFLVAWLEGAHTNVRLVAMRFDRDGAPLDAVPQLIASEARRSYVAATATSGMFWITYGSGTRLSLARIAANGAIVERDRLVPTTSGYWRDIETNGASLLVVSEFASQSANCVIGFCSASSQRGFASLPALDAPFRTPPVESSGYAVGVGTGLATDGTRYLAVSRVPNLAVSQWGWLMYGRLLDATGTNVLREFVIGKHNETNATEPPGGRVDATWTGSVYAVAYETRTPRDLDLRLSFVSPVGMALVDSLPLAASDREERHPVVLPLSEGRVLVLYERGILSRPEIVARTASLSLRTRAVR
jgi:hypothetical protein